MAFKTGLAGSIANEAKTTRKIALTVLNRFGIQRLQYLRVQQRKTLKALEDDGVLELHLFNAQKRADWQMDQLVIAGVEEFEAEKIVLREIIRS